MSKNKTKLRLDNNVFKLQKINTKKNILKEARGKIKTLPIEKQGCGLHQTFPQKPCKQEESRVKYLKYSEKKKNKTH